MMYKKLLSPIAVVLTAVLFGLSLPLFASGVQDAPELNTYSLPEDTYLVERSEYAVAPGVQETHFLLNDEAMDFQNQCYALTIDLSGPADILASYKDQDGNTPGMQSVRDQAIAAEEKRGVNVVAAVNADIYDIHGDGGTSHTLVMDGIAYNHHGNADPTNGHAYFAIMEDGTAQIREAGTPFDGVKEAIGVWQVCVRDGQNVSTEFGSDYELGGEPRTAVGIKEDGSVVFLVVDGRDDPFSLGLSWPDVADVMISMGCVIAGHLDGGDSTTLLSQRDGDGALVCRNTPSGGSERKVGTAFMIVSDYQQTNQFDHTAITADRDNCLPGEQVHFSAAGADQSGANAPLPTDGYFYLSDASMGSITPDGVFTSNGKTGMVTVQYGNGTKVYGSFSLTVASPDVTAPDYCGFVTADNGQRQYYYRGELLKSQWIILHKDAYYADENGYLLTGRQDITEVVEIGRPVRGYVDDYIFHGEPATLTYTFDDSGKLTEGATVYRNNSKYYIVAGVVETGWQNIGGDWYFFDGNKSPTGYGKIISGKIWTRSYRRYECDSSGKLIRGFADRDNIGTRYEWAGNYVTGWFDCDGWYWCYELTDENGNGKLDLIPELQNARLTGRRYFDPVTRYMVTDFAVIDGVSYYFNEDGSLKNGLEETEDGTVYLIDGVRQTGWVEINGRNYFFDPENNGVMSGGSDRIYAVMEKIASVFNRIVGALSEINNAFGEI